MTHTTGALIGVLFLSAAEVNHLKPSFQNYEGKAEMWLICPRYTLADIGLTTLLERLNVLGLEDRYWGRTKRPCLAGYWERARQRQSYKQGTPSVLFHMKTLLQGITYLSL
uniref:Uncharacterized protein n=1 Tax=Rhodnius prolixus TaxID=13249 RepID=T1HEY6_RHOPR